MMTDESLQQVYEKIQKLLNVTTDRGATVEEANNAAQKAQAILFKYNIDIANLDEALNPIIQELYDMQSKISDFPWKRNLFGAICKYNFCYCLTKTTYKEDKRGVHKQMKNPPLILIGKAHNIKFCIYLFIFLAKSIEYNAEKRV